MTYDNVKKYLTNYISARRTCSGYIRSVLNLDPDAGDMLEIAAQIDNENLTIERNKIEQYRRNIVRMILLLPNELHRSIMIDHYVNGIKWDTVADKYNYSPAHIFEINSRSIEHISKNMNALTNFE